MQTTPPKAIAAGEFHLVQIVLLYNKIFPQSWSSHVDIQNRLCKEAHSVSLQIDFFYDFILTFSYCGPDAPTFDKSDFEKGKVGTSLLNVFSSEHSKVGSLAGFVQQQ